MFDTVKGLAVVNEHNEGLIYAVPHLLSQELQGKEHIHSSSVASVASLAVWQLFFNLLPQSVEYDDEENFAGMADKRNGSVVIAFFHISTLVQHDELLFFPALRPLTCFPNSATDGV